MREPRSRRGWQAAPQGGSLIDDARLLASELVTTGTPASPTAPRSG
jgi:hypothetical protein